MSLLGIDVGSGSCKGVVFDRAGNILASANKEYAPHSPTPNQVEMDADVFWDAVIHVTKQVAGMVEGDPIEALSISSHGETYIPIDRAGNAVGPAVMNSDNRAVEQTAAWERSLGKERIYAITGLPLHPMFALNKIMWLREHKPEDYAKADRFVSVGDYILVKMGFPPYTDYSLASRVMAFDITHKQWSADILRHAGISEERLGIPVPSGTMAGKLSATTASLLGLREGAIVAVGGHDQPCGALGAGVISPGVVSDSAGSYECLAAVSDRPVNTPKALTYSLNSYCHVVPDRYVTLAFFPAGFVNRWYVDQFCYEDKVMSQQQNQNVYEYLDAESAKACPGPTGVCITPHLIGSCNPYWDVRATGAMVGLTPQITRHHLYKAIYEGIACELAINAEVLQEITGEFDCIRINGGNARSAFSIQLRADMTGKRISTLNTHEAVCKGAAMLAGIAAGVYGDAEDAVRQTVTVGRDYLPSKEGRADYERQMAQYRLFYPSLDALRAL